MMGDQVLTKALAGHETLPRKLALVIGGSLFIAMAAQISVPMFPVPMTLQTLAVLIVGLTFGSRLGAVTLLTYLAQGAAGLPVFAGGLSTAALMGPTAGFLVGFVGMAFLAGFAVERGLARSVIGMALAGIVVSALLYLPGIAWLSAYTGFGKAVQLGVLPFLIGDLVKAVIAALVVWGGWQAAKARSR